MPTILIVEDDENTAEAIAYHLRRAGLATIVAGNGLTGMRALTAGPPDVLVLDLMLPHIDGWQLIRAARERAPQLPIIVVTARANEHDRLEALALGADDVLAKPFSLRELVARVNAALRRTTALREAVQEPISIEDLHIDRDRVQVTLAGQHVDLTPLEYRLLVLLAEHRDETLTRDEIYNRVWGEERTHGDRSVDVLIRRLRRKVDECGARHTYIQTKYGTGYRLSAVAEGVARPTPSDSVRVRASAPE